MLYGNIIFIKKTGGDGSKYPVTEKSIKIGRSENCLIRIYNPQVAPEHCHLIIDDNGQAKLRNLSNNTILNDKPMSIGDALLCHGDIFKLGERLARWEYLPSSKYYKQLLSPSGRLVAVVMPQQRSTVEQITSGSSTPRALLSKSTPMSKRRYSERVTSETGSAKKILRLSSTNNKTNKSVNNVNKFLSGRHSLQGAKMLFNSKVKQRKSTSGIISSKTSKTPTGRKSRKSTLPSWKVNLVSPQTVRSPDEYKTPDSKSFISNKSTKKLVKSVRKSAVKTPNLNPIAESPTKQTEESFRSTRSLSRSPAKANTSVSLFTPEKKITSKTAVRLVNSERKLSSNVRKSFGTSKGVKRLSLALKQMNKTPTKSALKKMYENISKTVSESDKSPKNCGTKVFNSYVFLETPKNNVDELGSTKKSYSKSPSSKKKTPAAKTPVKSGKRKVTTPASVDAKAPQSKKTNFQSSTPTRSRSSVKTPPGRKSQVEEKSTSGKGVRRKLSPSISSAERAAKKLKTSRPRKPDKNKKAALLVLGKANRKQLVSQNVKVLLKQKIVKKAIKQSTAPPVHRDKRALGKKGPKKSVAKPKIKAKTKNSKPVEASKTQSESPASKKPPPSEEPSSKLKKEENLNRSKLQTSSPAKTAIDETFLKSPAKQSKKTESPVKHSPIKLNLSPGSSIKSSESYVFGSNRRCSKRLSSKNDVSRPDFMELSPTALGLIPKNVEVFKTPKESKRRSSSLATPKNAKTTTGIIKSASTSKIGNRKSVRFSSKDISINSILCTPNTTQGTDFDFESVQTPNITMDVFISPLTEKNSSNVSKKDSSKSVGGLTPAGDESSKVKGNKSPKSAAKCVRKLLQSPLSQKSPKKTPSGVKEGEGSSKGSPDKVKPSEANKSPGDDAKVRQLNTPKKSPKNDLWDPRGVGRLLKTPMIEKSPSNDLTDVRGVNKLLRTAKVQKSPKNELTDLRGVKQLLKTPRGQKSPKNELTDLSGVKQLLKTPRGQKSPKNELTDLSGVKQSLKTPRGQKSPKNELTDLSGVKQLLKTPRGQKSPKNELTDLSGVKQLLKTPRGQKSPKNELTDLSGVKQLLKTPRGQKSPKNELTDLSGVKQLLKTPRGQKSPKNELTDLSGVKQLLKTPRGQKSPKNDLTDVTGVRQLVKTPRAQKSPRNDLSDLREVRQSLGSPKLQKSPENDSSNVAGVRKPLTTPRVQRSSKNNQMEVSGVGQLLESPKTSDKSPQSQGGSRPSVPDLTGVKQLLIAKSPAAADEKYIFDKSGLGSLKTIRGRRTIYSSPKNDLSDVQGVRELFSRHKPTSNLNISLTGVARLFDLPAQKVEAVKKETSKVSRKKSVREVKSSETSEDVYKNEEEIVTRGGRTRRGTTQATSTSTRNKKEASAVEALTTTERRKLPKRKAVEKIETAETKKASRGTAKSQTRTKGVEGASDSSEVRVSRKRKITVVESRSSPPKLRRRQAATQEPEPGQSPKKETTKRATSSRRQKVEAAPEKQTPTQRKKVAAKAKDTKASKTTTKVQSTKTASKTSAKPIPRVQRGRSQTTSSNTKQSESKEIVSPRKTRSVKATSGSQEKKAQGKPVRTRLEKKKVSQVAKRSTRRK